MKFSVLFLSICVAYLGSNILNATPNDEAVAYLESELAELRAIVNNDDLDPELKRLMVENELENSLDLAAMSARAIQPFEEYLTTAEVIELVAEFETYLKHLYVNRVASFPGPSVDILEDKASADGKSVVIRTLGAAQTKPWRQKGSNSPERVKVDYRLGLKRDHWVVNDITIDGTNIVANFQKQFLSVIRRKGVTALIDDLHTRNEENTRSNPFE